MVAGVVGRGGEPGMRVGGVPGDKVEQHPDAPPSGFLHKPHEVAFGAVAGSDREVVRYVVSGIAER